jgi:hypothetical protein
MPPFPRAIHTGIFLSRLFTKNLLSKLASSGQQQCVAFPLCGKTLDMKAVLDAGHRVVGLEGSQKAAESFFQENQFAYEMETDENNQCHVYKVNHTSRLLRRHRHIVSFDM